MNKKKLMRNMPNQNMDKVEPKAECRCTSKNSSNNVKYNKSRVTILGRLGRTENDNYILTCAAKINDKPIATEFLPTVRTSIKEQFQYKFKDFRVASQSIQVNLGEKTKSLKQNEMSFNSNQATQCNFENVPQEITSQKITNEPNILKKCNSPLLVISIYPRADVTISADRVTRQPNLASRIYYNSLDRSQNRRNLKEIKDSAVFQRNKSRSISPIQNNIGRTKTQNKNVFVLKSKSRNYVNTKNKSNDSFHHDDTNFKTIEILDRNQNKRNVKTKNVLSRRYKSRSPSPTQKNICKKRTKNKKDFIPRTTAKSINDVDTTNSYSNHNSNMNSTTRNNFERIQNRRHKEQTRNEDIFGQRSKSRSVSPTPKNKDYKKIRIEYLNSHKTNTVNDNNTNQLNNSSFNINKKTKKRDINETNTKKVKKALVDSFINNLDSAKENTKCLLYIPKSNASRITINLDEENEHYDVVLVKSNDNTGLSVTKTLKSKASKNKYSDSNVNSVENFLMLRDSKANEKGTARKGSNKISKPKTKNKGSMQLKVRDSLDLSRCCERRSSYMKEQGDEKNDSDSKLGFSGTIKHYRGDNCSIEDPRVRHKGISQLLDLLRDQHKTTKSHKNPETIVKRSCMTKCSKTLLTNINSTQWLIQSFTHVPNDSGDQNVECSGENMKNTLSKSSAITKFIRPVIKMDQKYSNIKKITKLPALSIYANNQISHNLNFKGEQDTLYNHNSSNLQTQSHHLVLNNNYILFQVPSKRRQNLITKRQHTRFHVTENPMANPTVSENENSCRSLTSWGDVKRKEKTNKPCNYDRAVQTEKNNLYYEKCVQTESKNIKNVDNLSKNRKILLNRIGTISKVESEKNVTKNTICLRSVESAMGLQSTVAYFQQDIQKPLFNLKEDEHDLKDKNNLKHITSLNTIYKGRKKSATPNLGTSICSMHSNSSTDTSAKRRNSESKLKKHFLRRFMSCLLMRFRQIANVNLTRREACNFPSANTSIDSYYINTSLGPWDMSSILYDTSASFYTGHNIYPTTKTKRGFLSSIRDFITKQKL